MHWPPTTLNRHLREQQRSTPSLAGGAARGFLATGNGVADFQVLVQVVFDIKGVAREIAGDIKRLGMVEQIHLFYRHTVNLFSQASRLRQRP